jgi:peptide/nickel transport system substrate-binding protein
LIQARNAVAINWGGRLGRALRRPAAAALLCALGCALAAEPAGAGGTITVAVYDDPASLNPLSAASGSASLIASFIANGLTRVDGDGSIAPDIAAGWDVSADGLSWTFRLREGVRFSDGSECTADDVLASFTPSPEPMPANASPLAGLVKGYAVRGKRDFIIELREPYALLPDLCTRPIMPARLARGGPEGMAEADARPVGTGPFRLASREPGRVALEAFPGCFAGRPRLDRIVFTVFPDQKKAWTALMRGQVDLVLDIDQEDAEAVRGDPRLRLVECMDLFCYSVLFNTRDPLLREPGVRQALSAAIDREDLIAKALHGAGTATTGPFVPGTWVYNADPSLQRFDLARARELLDAEGWADRDGDLVRERGAAELCLTLLIDDSDAQKRDVARRLQWQLLQAGVRMDVEPLPLGQLVSERLLPGSFQAALIQMSSFANPDLLAATFWDSGSIGAYNLCAYANPQVDRLIREGRGVPITSARAEIYRRIHAILAQDAPAAFLYFKKRFIALSARLRGMSPGAATVFGTPPGAWYVGQ